MKNIPWLLTILAFIGAVVFVALKSKPAPVSVAVEAPKCPECKPDLSSQLTLAQEQFSTAQSEVERLFSENQALRAEISKLKRKTVQPMPVASDTATDEARAFADRLAECYEELQKADDTAYEFQETNRNLIERNKELSEALSRSEAVNTSLISNVPVETEEMPLKEIPLPKFKKHGINLGVGYFDKPFYTGGYTRNLNSWFSANAGVIYGDQRFGGQIGVTVKF